MNKVEQDLLANSGIEHSDLNTAFGRMMRRNVNFADIYFQSSRHETWVLEDGIIKEGSYNIERGVGVRAISGEKTGFAYSDEISTDAILKSADAAKSITGQVGNVSPEPLSQSYNESLYIDSDPIGSLTEEQKIALLKSVDLYVRDKEPRISQVIVSLSGVHEHILVAATDGTFATDIRPMVRLNCTVLIEDNGKRERGSAGGGGRCDYGYFYELVDGKPRHMEYADKAIAMAQVNLEAIDAPAGIMPVVLGNGWPGVLLHEAVGHGLEGDFNRKGSSAYSGKIGEKVASSACTVIDDGTWQGRRGSLTIDDEGTPSQHNVLIENGILKGYMQDKHNAGLMGVKPTGNGRRESYAHLPMPRMTNTYMLAGEHSQEEIISSVKKGIFAPNFGGGQVDITSGKFVFSASEAYLIEDGKITAPIKGATLIGNGPEAMQQVSMVGNDLELDPGVGVCGKDGQSVPVCVGQPTLKLDELTVGGTS